MYRGYNKGKAALQRGLGRAARLFCWIWHVAVWRVYMPQGRPWVDGAFPINCLCWLADAMAIVFGVVEKKYLRLDVVFLALARL